MKRFPKEKVRIPRRRSSLAKNKNITFNVINSLFQQPGKSIRTCAAEIQLSVGATHKIASKVLKLIASV
jgi:hypothetical protein